MDENEEQILDTEYKRFLEIMHPYLGPLLDQDVKEVCNAWINRLSLCKENEKGLRNKYIFSMCHQLAKGFLEEPFLQNPTSDELIPFQEIENVDNSLNESSEEEYLVVDFNSANTKILYNKNNNPSTDMCHSSELYETDQSNDPHIEYNYSTKTQIEVQNSQTFNNCPNILSNYSNAVYNDKEFEQRAANLIMTIREIKLKNLTLNNELVALKEDSRLKHQTATRSQDEIKKLDNTTSVDFLAQDSISTITYLKHELQEVQDSRKCLIKTVSNLQEKLDKFNELKQHEIEELQSQFKLEIIQVKSSTLEETKTSYEKNIDKLNQLHEQLIKDIQSKHLEEIETLSAKSKATLVEKNIRIQSMETEINNFKNSIDDLKNKQFLIFSNFLDHGTNSFNLKCITQKAEELEIRLKKVEKSKLKSSKAYEAKLANLHKEKHLSDCLVQLQLLKQRTQFINETANEPQTELATALNKLEGKYKDIVANIQATAVHRRIQDQMALESILQTVCGIRNEGLQSNIGHTTYADQVSNKQSGDDEFSTVIGDYKVGSVIVGNKTLPRENGYCLDGQKLNDFFERVYIPQRDTGECLKK